MAFIDNLHIVIILAVKVNSSGILTCSLSGLIFISFFLCGLFFLSPLIILLGFYPLFNFLLFFIFQNMGKQLEKARYVHIYKTIIVNSKIMNPIVIGPQQVTHHKIDAPLFKGTNGNDRMDMCRQHRILH